MGGNMSVQTIDIDLPDGWECVGFRPAKANEYVFDPVVGTPYQVSTGTYGKRIVMRPVWKWPSWLKADYIAQDESGLWCAHMVAPELDVTKGLWVSNSSTPLVDWVFDFTPPPVKECWRYNVFSRRCFE
jgi:hypothetical protein